MQFQRAKKIDVSVKKKEKIEKKEDHSVCNKETVNEMKAENRFHHTFS